MKISYAIPVHNEYEEIDRLLQHLLKYKREEDEIIVQCDQGNTTGNVYKVLGKYKSKIHIIEFPLNRDFASFKNNLKTTVIYLLVFVAGFVTASYVTHDYFKTKYETKLEESK